MASKELVLFRTFGSRTELAGESERDGVSDEALHTVYRSNVAETDSDAMETIELEGSRFRVGTVNIVEDGQFLPGGAAWILGEWVDAFGGNPQGFDTAAILRLANELFDRGDIVTLLIRVSVTSVLLNSWFEAGFQIAGTIAASARLSERAISAVVPVPDIFSQRPRCVLIMGRPNPNLLAQSRAMGRCGIAVYALLTRGEPPLIARSSRYLKGILDAQKCSDRKVGEVIREFAMAQIDKPVLMFAGDYDLGLAARVWPQIKDHVDSVTDPVVAARLADKQFQIDVAVQAGVPVPKSKVITKREHLKAIEDFKYPLICRPVEIARKGKFEGKVYVADSYETLIARLGPVLDSEVASVLIQEYIPGPGDQHYFLLASCGLDGDFLTPVMGRKLLENPKGRTNVGETLKDVQLEALSRRAFSAFNVSGVLGVEFKKDERDGTFYYIETNFRPDNFVAIAEASGINLILMAYLRVCGLPDVFRPLIQRHVIWQDTSLVLLSGISGKRINRKARKRPDGRKVVVVDALWASDDPFPGVVWYAMKFATLLRRSFSRVIKRRN